jgi:hypothetical protein
MALIMAGEFPSESLTQCKLGPFIQSTNISLGNRYELSAKFGCYWSMHSLPTFFFYDESYSSSITEVSKLSLPPCLIPVRKTGFAHKTHVQNIPIYCRACCQLMCMELKDRQPPRELQLRYKMNINDSPLGLLISHTRLDAFRIVARPPLPENLRDKL